MVIGAAHVFRAVENPQHQARQPPPAPVCLSVCLSVCVCVCLCVCLSVSRSLRGPAAPRQKSRCSRSNQARRRGSASAPCGSLHRMYRASEEAIYSQLGK